MIMSIAAQECECSGLELATESMRVSHRLVVKEA